MKCKKVLSLVVLFGFTLSILSYAPKVTDLLANSEHLYAKIKIFTSVLETIQRSYIEEKESDELLEDALKGVISNLDPHTVFLPADDFKSWNQSFEGYTGIGISFEILRGVVTVMSVMKSSPAEEAGIFAGDKITQINGTSSLGLTKEEAAEQFNGSLGQPVSLTIKSKRWAAPKKIQLIRERILLNSIPYSMMIRPGVGYIAINRFTSTTSRELEDALETLERKGMRSLILDLRGNSGGYLNAAVEVTDKFIPGGNSIVSTRGRLSSSFQEFYSTDEGTHKLRPLIILIDHGSASASEIVAGAIQDLDRGLIAGKTTFGKGLVQSQYRFHDGSALLITTAKYYTPSGRPIQRDFAGKSKDDYYREPYLENSQTQTESSHAKPFKTRLGRIVYGAGGIKPDVQIDTKNNVLSHQVRALYFSEERYFYLFAEILAKKYPHLKRNQTNFINNFIITDRIYYDFAQFIKANNPAFHHATLNTPKNREDAKFLIKRDLAYLLWGNDARFKVNMKRDRQLNVALKHFHEANTLLSMTNF